MMRRKTCTSNQAFHVDVHTMLGLADASMHSQVTEPFASVTATRRARRVESGNRRDEQVAMSNWQCSPDAGEGSAFGEISA